MKRLWPIVAAAGSAVQPQAFDLGDISFDLDMPETLPSLMERERVGRLSDQLVPLGKFKRTKENTPAGSLPGTHWFVAEFERGTRIEDLTLDADGKISAFHIRPSSESSKR